MNALVVLVAVMAGLVHAAPSYYTPKWYGPLASPTVLPSGYLADTPEVAALKAERIAALGSAPSYGAPAAPYASGWYSAPAEEYTPKWHGPLASPVVLPSGFLADTPEVAAIKASRASSYGHGGYYH